MNPELKTIADRVRKQANIPEDEQFGSVIAILMVISIILTIIRVIQECNKTKVSELSSSEMKFALYGEEMKTLSLRRGWFSKLRIKKMLRKQMSKEQYEKYSLSLINALFDNGENLKDDEVITLVEAANV
ncbi:hypothetical protein EB001_19325 [bacterium]|nr:hypothetical protein [bacterium]